MSKARQILERPESLSSKELAHRWRCSRSRADRVGRRVSVWALLAVLNVRMWSTYAGLRQRLVGDKKGYNWALERNEKGTCVVAGPLVT
jgi:type VI protein secretion system component VasF